jgi:hypothetical protein
MSYQLKRDNHTPGQPLIRHIPERELIPSATVLEYDVNLTTLNAHRHTLIALVLESMIRQNPLKLIYKDIADSESQQALDIIDMVCEMVYRRRFDLILKLLQREAYILCTSLGIPPNSHSISQPNAYDVFQTDEIHPLVHIELPKYYIDLSTFTDRYRQAIEQGSLLFMLVLVKDAKVF